MILEERVKSQRVSKEEHDFVFGNPMKCTIMVHTSTEGIDISKSCFFSLTP